MMQLLVDDEGKTWHSSSRTLRDAFDSPFSGGEFIEYSVKNLGFVAINGYGQSCEVRLRPGFVSDKAILALGKWLSDSHIQRVALTTFDKKWRHELIAAVGVEERLNQLVMESAAAPALDYLARPLVAGVSTMLPDAQKILASWPFLMANYSTETLLQLARFALNDRYVVIKRSDNQEKLIFHEISDEIYKHYETWRCCAVGAPIEEQPDRAFGRWVAGTYYEVEPTNIARQDAVDAIMRLPHVARRSRLRYHRLIFPVPNGSSGPLLVGGSIVDHSIDLRVGAT